jgi:hypothetical protein
MRLLSWFRPSGAMGPAWPVIALIATLRIVSSMAQPSPAHQDPDWPCRQILVGRLSLAAVWSGPPIDGLAWRNDPAVADLVAKLAARRTPLEDAEHLIDDFAQSQGTNKTKKLIAVFAGLFDSLDQERAQVIDGLLRFGAKQRELAAKIRTENASSKESATKPPKDAHKPDKGNREQDLEWDLRVFDERRQSLASVCETPTLIEQRLFALARLIQRNLE